MNGAAMRAASEEARDIEEELLALGHIGLAEQARRIRVACEIALATPLILPRIWEVASRSSGVCLGMMTDAKDRHDIANYQLLRVVHSDASYAEEAVRVLLGVA